MLSDRERQALSELESQFRVAAPRRGSMVLKVLAVLAIVLVAIVLAFVLAVTASVGLALGLAAGMALGWGSWLSIKNSQDGPHQ